MSTALAPDGLLCDLLARPELTLIANPRPSFSWIVRDSAGDQFQTALRINVGSSDKNIARSVGDIWDSGRLRSDCSSGFRYSGPALADDREYWWSVQTWNSADEPSPWAAPQRFRTGKLNANYETARLPIETRAVSPANITAKGPGHWFVDFGRAAFASLSLRINAPVACVIEVRLGEAKTADGCIDANPGGTIRYHALTVAVEPGEHQYVVRAPPHRSPYQKPGIPVPAHVGEVTPFRYCEIIGSPCAIDATRVHQVVAHYPFDDAAASMSSSDRVLDDVWELCRYSIKATSFLGIYIDGDRERLPYEADAYINQLCHYAVDREFAVARYSHEHLLTNATWPTEWSLHCGLMAWADYISTGDDASIRRYYPLLVDKSLMALSREDGLISTRDGRVTPEILAALHVDRLEDIVDWPVGERDGFEFASINSVVNAFHYRALEILTDIAIAIGRDDEARQWRMRADRTRSSFVARLFDPARGIFRDGEGVVHASLHANLFALAFGLVPRANVEGVVDFIVAKGMACSVYVAQYLLEALYQAGAGDAALRLMTSTAERSWAHMLYDVGSTMTLEAWDNRFKPNQDWNHAWGAAPGNIIPRKLFGVEPLAPGYARVRIAPQVGWLTHGTLTLPTIRGPIRVSFVHEPGRRFALTTDIPANVVAEVRLPDIAGAALLVDSRRADAGRTRIIHGVGSGAHVFDLRVAG